MRLLSTIPLFLLCFSLSASAGEPFIVSGLGGLAADVVKNKLIPDFEQQYGVKIAYYPENSAETLQRLRADKANGSVTDVAFMDDSLMDQAVEEKLCAKIVSYRPEDFDKTAHFPDARASGIGIVALGLMYNKQAFAEHGWPAPTSWLILQIPGFRARFPWRHPRTATE